MPKWSKKRSFALMESFSGLLVSSVCSLSSLNSLWYGLAGKRSAVYNIILLFSAKPCLRLLLFLTKCITNTFSVFALFSTIARPPLIELRARPYFTLSVRYFVADPVALNRFLDSFVVRPLLQTLFLNIRYSRFVLLSQGCCEVPGDHHVDIVFLRPDTRHKLKHLRPERVIEIEAGA